jgi:hypothetical protein
VLLNWSTGRLDCSLCVSIEGLGYVLSWLLSWCSDNPVDRVSAGYWIALCVVTVCIEYAVLVL